MQELNLSDLILKIRDELEGLDAERQQLGKPALFKLEAMELELQFTVSDSKATEGGFDLKVLSLGAEKSVAKEAVQKVKLSYSPVSGPKPSLGSRAHATADHETTQVDPI